MCRSIPIQTVHRMTYSANGHLAESGASRSEKSVVYVLLGLPKHRGEQKWRTRPFIQS
ncbi:protein of unknown function [Hyphomicrobium sp. MC1]|nr:protein of unknown function [Hyphomicrobium sp. MC1]